MAAIQSVSAQTSQPTVPLMDDRKQLLCRFHIRGSCRDGDRCQFSHNDQRSVPIPESVCWYNLQSRCMYGDDCRFVHSDASSILANHRLTSAAATPVAEDQYCLEAQPECSPLSTSRSTIPQTTPELSPQTIIANNTYNISSEVTQSKCKLIKNQIRPQLVPFHQSVLSSTPQQHPNQPSIPSLLTDSRQSSEDSGFSEATQPFLTSNVSQKCAADSQAGTGSRTYAQMASNKDLIVANQSKCGSITTPITTTTTTGASKTKTLCPYAVTSIDGVCPFPEGECHYTHGLVCDLCGRSCLHPEDVDQQNKHRDECIKEHEREMEISFAVQRSLDKACGICMDIVIEKEPITERRFGILEKCSHIFCLSCIRKWRQTKQFDNRTIRACPECRVSSDFVIPSKYWYDDRNEKQQLIDSYKRALSTKPCKYFKQGQGECPFAGACFYLHAYPDGRKAEMPPPRQRRRQAHDGELETLRDMLLWNYLEVRDDSHWLLTLDLEDVFDIQEMGLLSGYETDDESDLSDYAEGLIG